MVREWRDICGYDGLYQVSDDGLVRSLDREEVTKDGRKRYRPSSVIKQQSDGKGYLRVGLCKDGVSKTYLVHRLVAIAFIPNPEGKEQVNHIDENKKNNSVKNLEWVTNSENLAYGKAKLRNAISGSRPVVLIGKGKKLVIQSATLAEKAGYVSSRAIQNCCTGRQKTAGGYKWQYLDVDLIRDGGELMSTAEKLRDIAFRMRTCAMCSHAQEVEAIAATLGRGECEWVLREKWPNRTGDDHVYGYETSCGARHTWWPDSLPSFCPTCGNKVKAVKR